MPIDLGVVDPKQEAEVAKILKSLARSCKSAEDRLLGMRRKIQAPAITAKLGEISKDIYQSDQHNQNDCFSRLPNELKCTIWSYIDDPGDRLMFALTCKWNAATFEMLKESKQQPVTAKNPKKASTKSKTNTPSSDQERGSKARAAIRRPSKSDLISVLQRLQVWMPTNCKLCYECLRFRPRNAAADEKGFAENGGWGGRNFPIKDGKLTPAMVRKMTVQGQRCPECCIRKHMETQSLKHDFKEMTKIVRRTVGFNT